MTGLSHEQERQGCHPDQGPTPPLGSPFQRRPRRAHQPLQQPPDQRPEQRPSDRAPARQPEAGLLPCQNLPTPPGCRPIPRRTLDQEPRHPHAAGLRARPGRPAAHRSGGAPGGKHPPVHPDVAGPRWPNSCYSCGRARWAGLAQPLITAVPAPRWATLADSGAG